MEVNTQKHKNYVAVDIKGRLDTSNYKTLEDNLNPLIDGGEKNILINCKPLEYVSSSGLRVFLIVLKKIAALKGKLVFCNLNDNLTEVFEVSGFITIFNVVDSLEEAEKVFE